MGAPSFEISGISEKSQVRLRELAPSARENQDVGFTQRSLLPVHKNINIQSSFLTCGLGFGLANEGDDVAGVVAVVAAGEDWTEEEDEGALPAEEDGA